LSPLLHNLPFILVHALFHFVLLHIHFWNDTHLKLLSSQCEVVVLALSDLVVYPLNFESVFLGLRLKVLDLRNHFFKLFRAFLKGLLIQNKFLSDFRATLFSQNVFQFNIQLFLFLNQHVLLKNLLCLCNQSLLKRLDLLDQFVSIDVSRL
jgi:hypothetical protein